MATFNFDDGIATVGFSTICALRMRVSISAMGSLMLIRNSPDRSCAPRSPAGLDHAGDVTLEGKLTDLVARQAELAEGSAGAARQPAAIALAGRVGVAGQLLKLETGGIALFLGLLRVVGRALELG